MVLEVVLKVLQVVLEVLEVVLEILELPLVATYDSTDPVLVREELLISFRCFYLRLGRSKALQTSP